MRLSGALSAEMLRHYSTRIGFDPSADSIDLAWAALHRGDCAYFGPRRLGGCEVSDHGVALREYVEAGRAARAAMDAGRPDAVDAGPLLARALYSEAWMRARGEGAATSATSVERGGCCGRGSRRAGGARASRSRRRTWGWCCRTTFRSRPRRSTFSPRLSGVPGSGGSSSRPPALAPGFARRVADAFGGGTWRAMHTIESAPDRIYPRWRLYSSAMYAFFVYTVGMMAGWHYVVRPSARFMFGLELAPLPFQVWGPRPAHAPPGRRVGPGPRLLRKPPGAGQAEHDPRQGAREAARDGSGGGGGGGFRRGFQRRFPSPGGGGVSSRGRAAFRRRRGSMSRGRRRRRCHRRRSSGRIDRTPRSNPSTEKH